MPAGLQYWHKQTVTTCKSHFAYCSTLAVYVVNSKTFRIETIISGHENTITAILWSPHNDNLLASASSDCHFYIWDIELEKAKVHVTLPAHLLMMQWSPYDPNCVLMLLANGKL